jgi:hypothetical protein
MHRLLLALSALAASGSASVAGPCLHDIDRVQHQIDARLDARAGAGSSAPESTAATMDRQPTPGSIAAAEARLGELSPETIASIRAAMGRAREADAGGDKNTCEQALADVQRALGH